MKARKRLKKTKNDEKELRTINSVPNDKTTEKVSKVSPKKTPTKRTLKNRLSLLKVLITKNKKKCPSNLEKEVEVIEKPKISEDMFTECYIPLVPLNMENLSKYTNKAMPHNTFGIGNRYPKRKRTKSDHQDDHVSQFVGPFDINFLHNVNKVSPDGNLIDSCSSKTQWFLSDRACSGRFIRLTIILQRLNPDIILSFSKMADEKVEGLLFFIYSQSFKYVSETELLSPQAIRHILTAQRKLNIIIKRRIYNYIKKAIKANPNQMRVDLNKKRKNKAKHLNKTEKKRKSVDDSDVNKDINCNIYVNSVREETSFDADYDEKKFDGFDVNDLDFNDETYKEVIDMRKKCTKESLFIKVMKCLVSSSVFKDSLANYAYIKKNHPEQLMTTSPETKIVMKLYDKKLETMELNEIDSSEEDEITTENNIEDSNNINIDTRRNETNNVEMSDKEDDISTKLTNAKINNAGLCKIDSSKEDQSNRFDCLTKENETGISKETTRENKKNKSDNIEMSGKKDEISTEVIDAKMKSMRICIIDSSKEDQSNSFDCLTKETKNITKTVTEIKNDKSDNIEMSDKKDESSTELTDITIDRMGINKIDISKEKEKSVEWYKRNIRIQDSKPDIIDSSFLTNNTQNDKLNKTPKDTEIISLIDNEKKTDNLMLKYLKTFRFGTFVIGANKKKTFAKIKTYLLETEFLRKNISNGTQGIISNIIIGKPSMTLLSLFFDHINFNQNIDIHELYEMAIIDHNLKKFSDEIEINIFDFGLRIIAIRLHIKWFKDNFNPKLPDSILCSKMLKLYKARDVTDLIFILHTKMIPSFYRGLSAGMKKDWFKINVQCLFLSECGTSIELLPVHKNTSLVIEDTPMELDTVSCNDNEKIPENMSIEFNDNLVNITTGSILDFNDLREDFNDSMKYLDYSSKDEVEKLMIEIVEKNYLFPRFWSMCSDSLKNLTELTETGITSSDELIESYSMKFVKIYIDWFDREILIQNDYDILTITTLNKMIHYIKTKESSMEPINDFSKIIESEINQFLEKLYAHQYFNKDKDYSNIGYNNANRSTIKIKSDLMNNYSNGRREDVTNIDCFVENAAISRDAQSEENHISETTVMEITNPSYDGVSSIIDEFSSVNVFDDLNNEQINGLVPSTSNYNIDNDFMEFRIQNLINEDCSFSSDLLFENNIGGGEVIDVDCCEDILTSNLPNISDDMMPSTSHYNEENSSFNEIMMNDTFDMSMIDPQQSDNQMLAVNLNLQEVRQDEDNSLMAVCDELVDLNYVEEEIKAAADIDIPMVMDDMPTGFDNAGVLLPS